MPGMIAKGSFLQRERFFLVRGMNMFGSVVEESDLLGEGGMSNPGNGKWWADKQDYGWTRRFSSKEICHSSDISENLCWTLITHSLTMRMSTLC